MNSRWQLANPVSVLYQIRRPGDCRAARARGAANKKARSRAARAELLESWFHAALALGRLLISTRRGNAAAAIGAVISSKPLLKSVIGANVLPYGVERSVTVHDCW